MIKYTITLAVLFLSGCGAMVPTIKIAEMPIEQRRAVNALEILNTNQLIGKNYSIITIVEGISCKNKTWDPPATKTDALFQTKHWAREAGADAITNIQCDSPRGTTVTYNCWESITCTAEAIKLK
jgi:uncharacterized protein YbjQ (UPF0145 family)